MAEVLVISGVKIILSAVEAHVKSEIALAWGAKKELEKLQGKLVVLQLVLDAAEKRQVNEPPVRHWLENLKSIAYEAQDVMDEVSYEANHPENNINVTNRWIDKVLNCCSVSNPFLSDWRLDTVLNFCSSSNPFLFQRRMAHMIQDINGKFEKIKKEMEEYNFISGNLSLGPCNPSNDDTNYQNETSSLVTESRVVGREIEKSKLVAMLTNNAPASEEQESLSVLPIVGMGGLGKTTLVQLIYNDKQVKGYFKDLQMWVHVSEDFDVKKVLRDIIARSTNKSNTSTKDSSLQDLVLKLQKKLGGKRFLLVLDNVWNQDPQKWGDLTKALVCGAKESKIVVTTRKNEVASLVGTLPTYQLHPLSDDDAWSLLKQRAFRNSARSEERPDLAEVAKRVVRRCGGVPLALEIIGSQLRSRGENLEEWQYVENNEIWELPELKGIMKALMVSYHLLPSHLKQCFSYCSVFRKGESIHTDMLVQLWMAEGFLHTPPSARKKSDENKVLEEDVGREYAYNLLRCSFFQAEEWDRWGDRVVSFRMHDLVHDLAESVVSPADQTSVLVDRINKDDITGSRRLQIALTSEGASSTPQVLGDLMSMIGGDKLRVLILSNWLNTRIKIRNVSPLMKLKRLRILILKDFVEELPDSISDLKQLRYLDISGSKIKALPECINALYNLQTLKLNWCSNLQELPSDITRKLINLRHLEMRYVLCQMPKEMSRWRFLQTLPQFNVSEESGGGGISELKLLNHLRDDLRIANLENVETREDAESADLMKKQNIHELAFFWSFDRYDRYEDYHNDVLEGLRPHNNLHRLSIDNFMGAKFPTWLKSDSYMLPNLVEIHLQSLVHCAHLPAFGSFPKLRSLHLGAMLSVTCIGDEFYGCTTQPFPSLRTLKIIELRNLEEWNEAPPPPPMSSSSSWHPFPLLEELAICYSPRLRTAPTFFPILRNLCICDINSTAVMMFGITSKLTSLTSLEVSRVPDLTQIPPELISNNKLLQHLEIRECPMLRSFPTEELQGLAALQELKIGGFSKALDSFPFFSALADEQTGGRRLGSLKILQLYDSNITSLPEQIQHFTALEELYINFFPKLTALPDWLGNLPSLRHLELLACPELKHLPSLQTLRRLVTLQTLKIGLCLELGQRCANDQGEEWHKISHIPWVSIDYDINIFRGSRL